jgi:hypothetical protein
MGQFLWEALHLEVDPNATQKIPALASGSDAALAPLPEWARPLVSLARVANSAPSDAQESFVRKWRKRLEQVAGPQIADRSEVAALVQRARGNRSARPPALFDAPQALSSDSIPGIAEEQTEVWNDAATRSRFLVALSEASTNAESDADETLVFVPSPTTAPTLPEPAFAGSETSWVRLETSEADLAVVAAFRSSKRRVVGYCKREGHVAIGLLRDHSSLLNPAMDVKVQSSDRIISIGGARLKG